MRAVVYERRMSGEPFKTIAQDYGLKYGWVRQIFERHKRWLRYPGRRPMPKTDVPTNDESEGVRVQRPIMMVLDDPNVIYVSKSDFSGWEKMAVEGTII